MEPKPSPDVGLSGPGLWARLVMNRFTPSVRVYKVQYLFQDLISIYLLSISCEQYNTLNKQKKQSTK